MKIINGIFHNDLHLPFESGHSKSGILHLVITKTSWFNANCVELDQTAPLSRSTNAGHHANSSMYLRSHSTIFK